MNRFQLRDLLRDPDPNPGGGGDPPAPAPFDPVAFQKTLTDQFQSNLTNLDTRYKKQLKDLELKLTPPAPPPPPEPPFDPAPKGQDLEKIAMQKRMDALQKSFDEERKANQEEKTKSEQIDRFSIIRTKLAGMGLNGEAAIDTAFRVFKDEIKRADDGSLVGPDGEPFDKHMDRQIKAVYDFLLPAKPVGGANASKGNAAPTGSFDLDRIRPGMKPEERAAALAEIAKYSPQ